MSTDSNKPGLHVSIVGEPLATGTLYLAQTPGQREFRQNLRRAYSGLAVVILFSLLLMASFPLGAPPVVAGIGGTAAGLLIILYGTAKLKGSDQISSLSMPWLGRWAQQAFPALHFFAMPCAVSFSIWLIWISMIELGHINAPLLHILVGIFLLSIPLMAYFRECYRAFRRLKDETRIAGITSFVSICVVIFTALNIHYAIIPPGEPVPTTIDPSVIISWSAAAFIVIGIIIVFSEHVLRHRQMRKKKSV